MDDLVCEFAGVKRRFRLRFGDILDVEQACGKVGIGAVFQRLATSSFYANDVKQVLYRGLIGGGMDPIEADDLIDAQLNAKPLMVLAATANDVILATMTGLDPDEGDSGDVEEPFDFGKLMSALLQVGVTPEQVREMRYSDFVELSRAASGPKAPTEAEFNEMVANWKARQK